MATIQTVFRLIVLSLLIIGEPPGVEFPTPAEPKPRRSGANGVTIRTVATSGCERTPRGPAESKWLIQVALPIEEYARLLEAAMIAGVETEKRVRSNLTEPLVSQLRSGGGGEQFPQDVALRNRAREAAARFTAGSPAARFYRDIERYAEGPIRGKLLNEIERARKNTAQARVYLEEALEAFVRMRDWRNASTSRSLLGALAGA